MVPHHDLEAAVNERFDIEEVPEQRFAPEDEHDWTLQFLKETGGIAEKKGTTEDLVEVGDPHGKILALYDEFRPRLMHYLRSMYLKQDAAEELVQETFLRLTTELLRGKDIRNVQGWIVRVAHNLAVDAIKKRDKDAIHMADIGATPLERFADPAQSPEEVYRREEQAQRLEATLASLTPRHRQCFHLRAQGFRYKDIADALDISEQRAAIVVKQVAVRLAAVCG